MPKLHLISQHLNIEQLINGLGRYVAQGDNLLFIADSVAILLDSDYRQILDNDSFQVKVLRADVMCRGLEDMVPVFATMLSDEDMVELAAEARQVVSW